MIVKNLYNFLYNKYYTDSTFDVESTFDNEGTFDDEGTFGDEFMIDGLELILLKVINY